MTPDLRDQLLARYLGPAKGNWIVAVYLDEAGNAGGYRAGMAIRDSPIVFYDTAGAAIGMFHIYAPPEENARSKAAIDALKTSYPIERPLLPLSRQDAEAIAKERLARLADRYEPGGNDDWNALAVAARGAIAGQREAAAVFRRVFEEPGFAVSNSGMEVGFAALGLGLCGATDAIPDLATRSMPFNGIDENLQIARVLGATGGDK